MKSLGALALSLCLALVSATALAWDRGEVDTFATLPSGIKNPEGITVGPHGDLFVTSFAVTAPDTDLGKVVVFDADGRLRRVLEVEGSSKLLLGIAFHPKTHDLLVIDFGAGKVLKVNPVNGKSSVFTSIGSGSGLNALAFDQAGNVYISDSFQGVVWRTGAQGGVATRWVDDALLRTTGTPPFGANGMDFDSKGRLYVANTGDDRVIRIPVAAGTAGTPEVFVNSVNGADGLFIDEHDNVWVCANQADEIVVIDPTGRAIAKLGDFDGIDRSGRPRGLLFPASAVRSGDSIYITNLSLDIRLFGLPQAVDTQWAAEVTRHTIARIPARIPR